MFSLANVFLLKSKVKLFLIAFRVRLQIVVFLIVHQCERLSNIICFVPVTSVVCVKNWNGSLMHTSIHAQTYYAKFHTTCLDYDKSPMFVWNWFENKYSTYLWYKPIQIVYQWEHCCTIGFVKFHVLDSSPTPKIWYCCSNTTCCISSLPPLNPWYVSMCWMPNNRHAFSRISSVTYIIISLYHIYPIRKVIPPDSLPFSNAIFLDSFDKKILFPKCPSLQFF